MRSFHSLIIILTLMSLDISLNASATYDKSIEKSLKKQYSTVSYSSYADCYRVTSKTKDHYCGICNSNGYEIVPPIYARCIIEKNFDGETYIFAIAPSQYAISTVDKRSNKIFSLTGEVLDMGSSSPEYVPDGFVTAYMKPIYSLSGKVALDCRQTSLLPYKKSCQGSEYVEAGEEYLFFSKKGEFDEITDSYKLDTRIGQEFNDIMIVFSPKEFNISNMDINERNGKTEAETVKSISLDKFNAWLGRLRLHNEETCTQTITISIKDLECQ